MDLEELATDLYAQGNLAEAIQAYQQAAQLEPERADLLIRLGGLFQELSQPEMALKYYEQAVAVEPNNVSARQNLGYLLSHLGEPDQALLHYEEALRIHPSPMTEVLAASVLPVIYQTVDELCRWRTRYESRVTALADAGLRVETLRSQIPTNFYLAYQGQNDCPIARQLGRIYRGHEMRKSAGANPLKPRSGQLRIGFLSAFFRDHTIGRLNLGTIQHLSRKQFHVSVLAIGAANDDVGRLFEQAADRYLSIPPDVAAARTIISEADIDVLIFADVGMDAIASTLAHSRMAPVQCVSWGHPDTTGSMAIDYFLSGELLETAEASAHYTEQLVKLPGIGVYYERPVGSAIRSRESLGIDHNAHVYCCPQTLFKLHPDFDSILAGILEADRNASIVLLEGRVSNWKYQIQRRFARTLPEEGRRVRFLPSLPYHDFLSLLAVSDVILDPIHFGGGNSSFEALAMGTPIVSLPGEFLRGRITAALYNKMQFTELLVRSPQEFIDKSVALGTDRQFNQRIRKTIQEKCGVLFADLKEVKGLEQFLWSLTQEQRLFVQ